MFIIDFKNETIRKFTKLELCLFMNQMISDKDPDLFNKRYLFIPNQEAAKAIVTNLLEKSNAKQH